MSFLLFKDMLYYFLEFAEKGVDMQQSNFDRDHLVEGGQGRKGMELRKESKLAFWMFVGAIIVLFILTMAQLLFSLIGG